LNEFIEFFQLSVRIQKYCGWWCSW